MEKRLNVTPVRTTNNFKINDIKLDIPDIVFDSFEDYKIDGEYTSSINTFPCQAVHSLQAVP